MQYSLILARDLPLGSPTLGEKDTIPIVRGEGVTERISVTAFTALSPSLVASAPSTPSLDGTETSIAWDNDGVYTYKNGVWGKSPRLVDAWDDLDQHSRFLLVNKEVQLSDAELNTVRKTLEIQSATTEAEGLVKLAKAVDANDGGVLTGPQVMDYVATQLAGIVPEASSAANLNNYTGEVLIKGPRGEVLMTYDSDNKVLYIGGPEVDVVVKSKTSTQIIDAQNNTIVYAS